MNDQPTGPIHGFSRHDRLQKFAGTPREGTTKVSKSRGSFMPATVLAEDFFARTVETLECAGWGSFATTLRRKAVFLDLGRLNGFTTFILWIGCPEAYELFTDANGSAILADAAHEVGVTLCLEGSTRLVIGRYEVETTLKAE